MAVGPAGKGRASLLAMAIAPRDNSAISASLSMATRATVRDMDARASAGRTVKTTTFALTGKELTGSRVNQESGSFAVNGSTVVGRIRMAPSRADLDHIPCATMK